MSRASATPFRRVGKKQGCACRKFNGGKYAPGHSRWVHFWQRMEARALTIEITYFHGDDKTDTAWEWELGVPNWLYRPRCWIKGHADSTYGYCIYCHAPMSPWKPVAKQDKL